MDIRDRVMADQPNDFLHKIASIVPGYSGYVDKERRREADKLLRTELARHYTAQRDRLNRVQQALVRSRQFTYISEVDRIVGIFQRFIDRLSVATYGYAGLFDPVKVDAAALDQIYAFDMALADGVEKVSNAIDAVDSASGSADNQELPAALTRLSNTVDELNSRLNQRSDFLTSGRGLPEHEAKAILGGTGASGQSAGGTQGAQQGGGYTSEPGPYVPPVQAYQPNAGYGQAQPGYEPNVGYGQSPQPQSQTNYQPSGYSQYTPPPQGGYGQPSYGQQTGGGADASAGDWGTGTPTSNLNMQTNAPNQPGMGGTPEFGSGGVETASSPTHSTDPSSPGQHLTSGAELNTSAAPDAGAPGSSITDLPGTSTSTGSAGTGSSTDVPPTTPGQS